MNPGFTILIDEDLFSFGTNAYVEDLREFAAKAAKNIAYVKAHLDLKVNPEKDDVLYMSPYLGYRSQALRIQCNYTQRILYPALRGENTSRRATD